MTSYPYTTAGLTAALTALGNTPTAVAVTLAAGGHRGDLARCDACPIAQYLRAMFPNALDVAVASPGDPIGATARLYLDGDHVEAELPAPVISFIDRFDAGGFRQLWNGGHVDALAATA